MRGQDSQHRPPSHRPPQLPRHPPGWSCRPLGSDIGSSNFRCRPLQPSDKEVGRRRPWTSRTFRIHATSASPVRWLSPGRRGTPRACPCRRTGMDHWSSRYKFGHPEWVRRRERAPAVGARPSHGRSRAVGVSFKSWGLTFSSAWWMARRCRFGHASSERCAQNQRHHIACTRRGGRPSTKANPEAGRRAGRRPCVDRIYRSNIGCCRLRNRPRAIPPGCQEGYLSVDRECRRCEAIRDDSAADEVMQIINPLGWERRRATANRR